jgi:hypothetical protein
MDFIQPQPLHEDRKRQKVADANHLLVVALLATAQASYFNFERQVPLGGGEPFLIDNLFFFNLILGQGAPLLFNDGECNNRVLPLQQGCLCKLALATFCYFLHLQFHSRILTDCFLFPFALLP